MYKSVIRANRVFIRVQGIGLFLIIQAVLVLSVLTTHAAVSKTAQTCDRLIAALIQVESNGKDQAIGDHHMNEKAYGPLQIRKPCVDDVNRRFGTNYQPKDMLGNRSLSVLVCRRYLEMYATSQRLGREPTEEDMARIWNGGPNGWRKQSTLQYWNKVVKHLK